MKLSSNRNEGDHSKKKKRKERKEGERRNKTRNEPTKSNKGRKQTEKRTASFILEASKLNKLFSLFCRLIGRQPLDEKVLLFEDRFV